MNQHIDTRTSISHVLLAMPVVGMLSSLAFAGGAAQPAPAPYGWGKAVVWGDNWSGHTVPADLGPVMQVAAGGSHTVILKSDGTVRGW